VVVVNQLLVSVVVKKATGHAIVLNLLIIVMEVVVEGVVVVEVAVVAMVVVRAHLRVVRVHLARVQDHLVEEEAASPQEIEDRGDPDRALRRLSDAETDHSLEALHLAKDHEVLLIAKNVHDLFRSHLNENSEDQDHHHPIVIKMVQPRKANVNVTTALLAMQTTVLTASLTKVEKMPVMIIERIKF